MHPGENKLYPLALHGFELEALGEAARQLPHDSRLKQVIDNIANQVPYQF